MLINDASITGSLIVNASSSFQNIAVSGNILPGTNNVYNLGSVDKFFKEIFVSTGSINFVDNTGIKTTISSVAGGGIQIGSVQITTSSISFVDITGSITQTIAQSSSLGSTSNFTPTSSFNAYTQSFSSSVSSSITSISSSVTTTITTLSSSVSTSFSLSAASVTSLSSSVSSSVTSLSSSLTSVNTTQNSRLGTIESITGSYATTGSNTFFGLQTFSGSVYIANDLVVQGSSSIQYISASSVSIGTNIVQLNTANPSVRFAGLTIIDSGSIGGSGSFLYDSVHDEFVFVHRGNGTNVTSSHFVLGPETYDSLGNETYLTNNRLPKGTGKEHLVDSQISDDGTTVSIGGALTITGNITGPIRATNGVVSGSSQIDLTTTTNYASGILTRLNAVGVFSGSSQVSLSGFNTSNLSENTNLYYTDARVKTKLNAETVVSGSKTISGITLGSNLATLTIGTGLSGTSYNGSTGVTIANSGVTSIVAGTGISINQGTAAVTVTNTITNNNQLTNGAGYITSAGNATNITAYTINQNVGTSNSPTFCGLNLYNGISTGRSSYGISNANLILYPSAADSTGYSGIDFRSGNNYPSDGAQIYFESNTGSSEKAKLTIRVENDLEDFMELRAGNITLNANTVSGGGQNPSIIFQNAGTNIVTISSGGTITASGDVTAYSDVRIKENILNIIDPLNKVLRLRGVSYNRTDIEDKSTKIGFIAQEVEKIVPEVVTYDKKQDRYGVSYGNITALLVEAIKEQQIKIDNLTIEVENLKKPKGL
jgi:hypothetical protein